MSNLVGGNSLQATITERLAPVLADQRALESRVTALERDLSAARLRNARLHDEVDALRMALGAAQTLISAQLKPEWTEAQAATALDYIEYLRAMSGG